MDPAVIINRLREGFLLARERMPRILEDPRAYPRETMIVALIAAVMLLVIVLAVVFLFGYLADRANRRVLKLHRRPRAVALRWLAAFGIVGVVAFAIAVSPMVAATSEWCGSCHAVKASVDTWRADVHADVGCYGCHARPGVAGAIEATARGLAGTFASAKRLPVDAAGCADCHDDVARGTLTSGGLRVRHSDIIAAGVSCIACHSLAGHSAGSTATAGAPAAVVSRRIAPRSRMARCLQCHEGKTASAACETCHVGRQPSDMSEFAVPFGDTPAPTRCDACHPADVQRRCTDCHGLELPHPPAFMGQHAGMSSRNPQLCAKCHETASAQQICACHQETNEHGTYSAWFPVHGPAASQNGPGGCRCHATTFCGFCHERPPFP